MLVAGENEQFWPASGCPYGWADNITIYTGTGCCSSSSLGPLLYQLQGREFLGQTCSTQPDFHLCSYLPLQGGLSLQQQS